MLPSDVNTSQWVDCYLPMDVDIAAKLAQVLTVVEQQVVLRSFVGLIAVLVVSLMDGRHRGSKTTIKVCHEVLVFDRTEYNMKK